MHLKTKTLEVHRGFAKCILMKMSCTATTIKMLLTFRLTPFLGAYTLCEQMKKVPTKRHLRSPAPHSITGKIAVNATSNSLLTCASKLERGAGPSLNKYFCLPPGKSLLSWLSRQLFDQKAATYLTSRAYCISSFKLENHASESDLVQIRVISCIYCSNGVWLISASEKDLKCKCDCPLALETPVIYYCTTEDSSFCADITKFHTKNAQRTYAEPEENNLFPVTDQVTNLVNKQKTVLVSPSSSSTMIVGSHCMVVGQLCLGAAGV